MLQGVLGNGARDVIEQAALIVHKRRRQLNDDENHPTAKIT
jgi:hypothetical protein